MRLRHLNTQAYPERILAVAVFHLSQYQDSTPGNALFTFPPNLRFKCCVDRFNNYERN